jgi:outer membrane protein insertion porin family
VTRGVALFSIIAFGLGSANAFAQPAPAERSTSWLQRRLETGLAAATGGSVRIGRIDVDWTALTATVGDVAISIPAEGAPPLTATLAEGRVKLAWSGLGGIAAGDIHITEVIAKGATFSCSREWIDAWKPSDKKKDHGAVAIQIDRLVVDDATGEYLDGHQRFRVSTTATTFRGDWSSSRRLLIGEVSANALVEAPFFERPWPATVRGGLRLGGGRLEIFSATGEGPGAQGELAGNVTWGAGASFTASGRLAADLAALSPYLVGHLPLKGQVDGPLQIVYTSGVPIRVTMQAATTGFLIGPVATDTARADLTIRPGHLDVANIDARAYAGAFTGTVGLTFGQPIVLQTDLAGKGADLSRLIALAGRQIPIASVADVTFAIEGDAARPATWTGTGTFDAVAATRGAPGRVPTAGRGRVTFASGRIRVEADPMSLGEASLRLALQTDLSKAPAGFDLTLEGETRSARKTQLAALTILDAIGVSRNRFAVEPVEGSGHVKVAVTTGRADTFDLALTLSEGSYAGQPFDSARFILGVTPTAVEIKALDLDGDGASVSGTARFEPASGAVDDLELTGRGVRIASVLKQFDMAPSIDGRVDCYLRGFRADGEFAAQGTVVARNVIVGHDIVDTIEGPVRIEGDHVILDGLTARTHGFEARSRVVYDLAAQEAEITLESGHVDVGSIRTLAEAGVTASGTIDTEGQVTIASRGPSGLLRVAASQLLLDTGRSGLREIRLGDLGGTAAISPTGMELTVRSMPEAAWTFDAYLGFAKQLPLSAVLYFEDLVVGAGGAFGESADLRLKGQVQAEGDVTEPRAMEINGVFDEVAVRLGSRFVRAAAPFPVRLESGQFVLGPARLTGEAVDVELAGSGSLEGAVGGYLRGTLDLAIASSLWSEIRGSGPVEVDATLGGTLDRPDLEGRVAVHNGRLRLIGYPQSLESIDAEARFSGQTLTLASFHAFQGGGEISATGHVEFQGLTPASFQATFDAANVNATFPEGFKGTYEGRITVAGTPKRATIGGRIDVVRGVYAKDFDLGLFGGAHREFDAAAESPFPRNVFLDVDVVAPGNVWLRNDVAKVEAQGQLHLGGELTRPEVTGRFSLIPGGTVRYRDVDYTIEYGTLDQTDPKRINPYVDFRGRTRVAEYEIGLHVEGTLDKFDYELTSTPPLSSQDIISLLVTGKTLDALAGSASASAVPTDMAAYYFAGLLSATFGKQIQSSLGIDQLEITPLLLKGESDPTARVTVGKRVSDDVKILFSQDIGTAQKQTYQVSWDVTRRVRLVAESDTENGVGGEMQYAQQFGGTPISLKQPVVPGIPGTGTDAAGPVASVGLVSDDATDRRSLVKKASIAAGQPFDRGRMLLGADRIRAALVKQGFIQAGVRAEASSDGGSPPRYAITYRVSAGPKVDVTIVMSGGGGKHGMKKALKAFSKETPYTPDFWDEAAHALADQLQQDGYYAADVTWHATDEPGARAVRILVDRGKPVRLRAIRFTGVASIPQERIDKQMTSLKSSGWKKARLRPSVLDADLASVRALYREEGFTRVRIARPRIQLAATGDSAVVDVAIEEGTRFTVGDVDFASGGAASPDELAAWAGIATGQTFSPRRLAEAEQTLKDRLDALGYPDVTVESQVGLSSAEADISFDVVTGLRKTVGQIAIEGNRVTKNRTIAKALTFGEGSLVSRQALLASQQQLYRMGLFSNVKLTFAPDGGEGDPAQRVTVRVDEAPPLSFGFGVGYDSSDGPRASVLLGYSNLGGRNVAIAVQGRVSAKQNQGVLTIRRRRVFGNTIDSLASLVAERIVEDSFTQSRRSLSFRFEQRPKPRWIRYLRYSIQQVHISDIIDAQAALEQIFKDKLSDLRLADLGVGLVRDTRDDAFLPTRGGYGSIEGSVFAKPLGSEATFAKLFLRGSWTVPLKRGNQFASFLRIGAAYPFADTSVVPLSERFFAGGSNTLRGFATDSVGGLSIAGFNAGGEALLLLNEEWHFPIWKSLRGEVFLDAGNVYPTISEFRPTDLRSSAGVGLRLNTPIGPIRIEYGWKLDRQDDESAGEVVFAIGTVF